MSMKDDTDSLGIMLTRISDTGVVLWKYTFDNISIEMGLSLIETRNEGYAMAGTYRFFDEEANAWNRDVFLLNFDEEGQIAWNQTYGESLDDWGYSLVECRSGGFAISGTTDMLNGMKRDMLLIRTDEAGNHLWNKTIGGSGHDEGWAIVECDDSGFVVVGSTVDAATTHEAFIIRTNAEGEAVWNRTYSAGSDTVALSLCDLGPDRFAITGLSRKSATSSDYALFLLVESDGKISQSSSLYYDTVFRPYHYYYDCGGHDIVQSQDGNLTIIGSANYLTRSDNWEIMLMRIDSHGTLITNSTYGGDSWETGCSLVSSGDGGYALAGVRITFIE